MTMLRNSLNSSYSRQDDNFSHSQKIVAKFEGFDFLRAIFAIAVVGYKTQIFYIPEMLITNDWTYGLSRYILSGMFGALAVPVFLQISLFLFYYKSMESGINYFVKKRLPKLISLYSFWVVSITIFDVSFVSKLEGIQGITSSLKSFLEFVVSGNSTPYFFFFSLVFLTILAGMLTSLFSKLKKYSTRLYVSYFLLFLSCILILFFSAVEPLINYIGLQGSFYKTLNSITQWDYNPINFLPYIFTSAITMQEYKERKLNKITKWLRIKLSLLLFLGLAFFALEWILTSNRLLIQVDQAPLDHYMRISLIFISWLLLYISLLVNQKAPKIIGIISKCSLGIYGFHVFLVFKGFFKLSDIFPTMPILGVITNFSIVLTVSLILTLIFRKIKFLKNFV